MTLMTKFLHYLWFDNPLVLMLKGIALIIGLLIATGLTFYLIFGAMRLALMVIDFIIS